MSNKTPVENAKKIKLALKYPARILLVLVSIALVLIAASRLFLYLNPADPLVESDPETRVVCFNQDKKRDSCVNAYVADSNPERMRGLSRSEFLPVNQGMLFVFEQASEQCFWMKDMNFSIDMIFMDSNKKVTKIYSNVAPATYPESFCADDTKYVLEVNAGIARQSGVREGQMIEF